MKCMKLTEFNSRINTDLRCIDKKKEPDWGKGQALRNAGWSVGAIARELKTTYQKVYYHTKKPVPRRQFEHEWCEKEPTLMRHNNMI